MTNTLYCWTCGASLSAAALTKATCCGAPMKAEPPRFLGGGKVPKAA